MAKKRYWLMKSEPDAYSIDDFKKEKKTPWDGIRNYQARNFMIKEMQVGDEFLFYHSNAKPPGVVGLGVVSKPASADVTAQDPKSKYYDPKATEERPIWECVEVKFKEKFKRMVSLDELKETKGLEDMMVIRRGARLSIQPVSDKEFKIIYKLANAAKK